MAPGIPEAAICVQVIAAQYILQFAIVIALCCALHRSASRVIHRSECFINFSLLTLIYLKCFFIEQTVIGAIMPVLARCLTAHRIPVRGLRIYKRYAQSLLSILPSKTRSKRAPQIAGARYFSNPPQLPTLNVPSHSPLEPCRLSLHKGSQQGL